MTIDQLLEQLTKLFPDRDHSQWRDGYRAAFGNGGVPLEEAWRKTMATWTRSSAPKPGDIAKHLSSQAKQAMGAGSRKGETFDDYFNRNFCWLKLPVDPPYYQERLKVWKGEGPSPSWCPHIDKVIADLGYDPRIESRCIDPWKEFSERSKDWPDVGSVNYSKLVLS